MAQSAANILAGPARIFVGLVGTAVLPVSGTPPALFQHTAGVPSGLQTGFTEIGFTEGPVEFTYQAKKAEINPEQSYFAVDVYLQEELAQVKFKAMERTYVALQTAFDSVGTVSDASKDLFYFGGGTTVITARLYCVMFSSPHRDNGSKYGIGVLYRTYNMEGVKLAFTKTAPSTFDVTLKALADVTRSPGDTAGQFFHEK